SRVASITIAATIRTVRSPRDLVAVPVAIVGPVVIAAPAAIVVQVVAEDPVEADPAAVLAAARLEASVAAAGLVVSTPAGGDFLRGLAAARAAAVPVLATGAPGTVTSSIARLPTRCAIPRWTPVRSLSPDRLSPNRLTLITASVLLRAGLSIFLISFTTTRSFSSSTISALAPRAGTTA